MKYTLSSTLAPLALILAGCTSVSQTVLMHGLSPVPPESVKIFLPGDSIPPHDRVAFLAGSGDDVLSNRTQLLEHLRLRAGELGANGVILGDVEEASSGAKIVGYLSGFGADRNQDAIAILIHSYTEYEELTDCDILRRSRDEAWAAYENQKNNANRQRMQDTARKYHEQCE